MVKAIAKEKAKKTLKVTKTAGDRKRRQLSRRFHKLKVTKDSKRGVIYIGHLPKGFNENELKQFFQQFGPVTKLRVARSVKTARPKGYAFLEFGDRKVAEIAAKAMDKYMIFNKTLDVHVVDEPHFETFKHGNRDWKFVPTQAIFRAKKNADLDSKTPEQRKARVEGLLQKEKEKRDRLKELQIDYEFPGFKALVDAAKPAAAPKAKAEAKGEGKKKKGSK